MEGIFVTGTDTEVGKTLVASALAHLLVEQGRTVIPRKPIASGCFLESGQIVSADTQALMAASQTKDSIDTVTPYRFIDPLAPNLAARNAGKSITIDQLYHATMNGYQGDDFLLVEGAGGFYSPMAGDGLCADLAKRVGLKVVLVVNNRLGCINHTILSVNAIRLEGLELHSIIVNDVENNPKNLLDNQNLIEQYTDIKVFHLPHFAEKTTHWSVISQHLLSQNWQV